MKNNNDNIAKETLYGLSIPSSLSAEEVLFGFVNELKDLIASLDGYTNIISKVGADPNYVSGILRNINRLRSLSDSARVYLMETNYLPKEKEVMHFLRENVFDPIMHSPEASNELKELVVETVHRLNTEADWQMVVSWLSMASKPAESEVIQKMKEEGFTQFEITLVEFRTHFAQE